MGFHRTVHWLLARCFILSEKDTLLNYISKLNFLLSQHPRSVHAYVMPWTAESLETPGTYLTESRPVIGRFGQARAVIGFREEHSWGERRGPRPCRAACRKLPPGPWGITDSTQTEECLGNKDLWICGQSLVRWFGLCFHSPYHTPHMCHFMNNTWLNNKTCGQWLRLFLLLVQL